MATRGAPLRGQRAGIWGQRAGFSGFEFGVPSPWPLGAPRSGVGVHCSPRPELQDLLDSDRQVYNQPVWIQFLGGGRGFLNHLLDESIWGEI